MKKSYWISIFVVAFILLIALCNNNNNKQVKTSGKETVKIGITLPLTGPLAYLTENTKAIALYAENEINKNKNNKYNYKVIIENNNFEGKKAALSVNKLVSVDKVDALISYSSKVGNVVAPIAETNKIVHINPFASDKNVAKGKYNFLSWTQPKEQCQKLIEIFNKKNIKTVVTYLANDAGAIAVDKVCDELMKENNIKNYSVVSNASEKDFRTTVQKHKDINPDIYFLLHFPPVINLLVKQMRENNINTPITAIEAIYFVGDDKNFDDSWFVTSSEINEQNMDVFNKAKVNDNLYGVGNMYDALMMLYQAYEENGKDNNKVSQYLENLDTYEGIVGKTFKNSDGIFTSEAIAKIKKGNKFLPYEGA